MATDAEEFGPSVVLSSKGIKPVGASSENSWAHRYSLDICDSCRASIKPSVSRERGFEPGLAGLSFKGLNQSSFFSANVSPGSSVNIDVKVKSTVAGILAKEAFLVSLVNSLLKLIRLIPELASYINVGSLGSHGATDNEGPLN